jgi:hypothetical protein
MFVIGALLFIFRSRVWPEYFTLGLVQEQEEDLMAAALLDR